MKCHKRIAVIVLGILMGMPSTVFSRSSIDSLVLRRMFNYSRNYTPNNVTGHTTNVYIKSNFNVWRRNTTLWLVPSMYSIAEGDRYLVSESYNKLIFNDINDYEKKRHVSYSTIRHNRRTLPTVVEFMTPNIYDVCLYDDHILSPFNYYNRHFYRYHVLPSINGRVIIEFKPRLPDNTQLVSGQAYVDIRTGRVHKAIFNGEFDMISFHTESIQGEEGVRSLLPKECRTNVVFYFMGNKIYSTLEAIFDCPVNLPDSIDDQFSLEMMDSIRPIPLTAQEKHILNEFAERHKPDTTQMEDTMPRKFNFAKDVLQDAIGDNLVTSIRYRTDHAYLKISPILNPQYLSYSSSHGFSYKIKLGAEYYFNSHRFFEFNPRLGYNFKYKKPYFTLPLYFNYNPKRNGQVQVVYGNGNRIGNGDIIDDIKREQGDTVVLSDKLHLFGDNYLIVSNNVVAFDWLEITSGFTYHHRVAYQPEELKKYGKQQVFNSFAPMLSVKLRPWKKGPVLSVDYERGIEGIINSDIDYERWEFDGSLKYDLNPLRKINLKLGLGFYSRKKDSYFVDYIHFRDDKLPEGWDDDWTGNFQLLDSRWYNESRYYARANLSYESPFLVMSWFPLIGHFFEKERFYLSALSIDHTRPYTELGYGFTTRLVSIGVFTSFLRERYQNVGCKFTFELFRRW